MFFFSEFVDVRRVVSFVDVFFVIVLFDIGYFVDVYSVFFIEGNLVELFGGSSCFGR